MVDRWPGYLYPINSGEGWEGRGVGGGGGGGEEGEECELPFRMDEDRRASYGFGGLEEKSIHKELSFVSRGGNLS